MGNKLSINIPARSMSTFADHLQLSGTQCALFSWKSSPNPTFGPTYIRTAKKNPLGRYLTAFSNLNLTIHPLSLIPRRKGRTQTTYVTVPTKRTSNGTAHKNVELETTTGLLCLISIIVRWSTHIGNSSRSLPSWRQDTRRSLPPWPIQG